MQRTVQNDILSVPTVITDDSRLDSGNFYQNIIANELHSMESWASHLNQEDMDQIVTHLSNAKKRLIVGARSSYSAALWMGTLLNQLLGNTKVVHEFYDSNFEYLTEASEDTVVLLISFARYTKWSLKYAQIAKNHGAKILAITDSISSPAWRWQTTLSLQRSISMKWDLTPSHASIVCLTVLLQKSAKPGANPSVHDFMTWKNFIQTLIFFTNNNFRGGIIMQEILDIFLEKSKQHHSNIIYAQIYKNDLLKEEFRLFPVKTRLNIWSISKPFVAMAAGIAEREGLITLDEYIYPWFEKYFPSDPSENLYKIKIRDLLTMSSGQKDPLFFCDGPERYREKDWVRYFFQNDSFPYTPGTHFVYSNFCSYILSVLLEEKSGTGLLNYLRYRFFEPVGIPNPDWTLCPQGHCMAANGLYLTIDELARFGHLLLHEGSLNGKQIVPKNS